MIYPDESLVRLAKSNAVLHRYPVGTVVDMTVGGRTLPRTADMPRHQDAQVSIVVEAEPCACGAPHTQEARLRTCASA